MTFAVMARSTYEFVPPYLFFCIVFCCIILPLLSVLGHRRDDDAGECSMLHDRGASLFVPLI